VRCAVSASPLQRIEHGTDTWYCNLRTEIDTETDKLTKSVADLEKEREKRETQQSDDQRSIARQQKNVERYLAKRQVLLQRKDECNKNIRDLGVLPDEAFAETTATSEKVRLFPSSLSPPMPSSVDLD
jgi:chromosome segregation ATPase